jgi:pimeloyl-ACP methyl ester carboxylesterase
VTDPVPTELRVRANGLVHRALAWGPAEGEPILLAHGFLDHAWSWRAVASHLAAAGRRAIAFDWRGHGETDRVGAGGYYHFADYVLDLAELAPQLAGGGAYDLVGHSMGGTACAMFAGARPAGLRSLVLCEGLGPPEVPATALADRLPAWLDGVARTRAATPKPMRDAADAARRLRQQHAELGEALALFLAEKGTHPTEGGVAWSFDPLHRTTSPYPFLRAGLLALLARIEVPVLVVTGTRGFRTPDHAERVAAIPGALERELEASHMMHWYAPDALARAVLEHVSP